MEREKEALTEIAQAHEFEIISLGGGRPHMELPEYRAAAQRLEAVQEQVIAAEQEIAALEKQRKALQGNVKLLKAVEKVKPDLDAIQPEKTLTGAVKGVTVEQVKELKAAVIRGAAAEQKVVGFRRGSRKGSGRCWTFWISTCRSSSGPWSKRRGSCYLCQRCSSRKESRNGATPGAVWSCKRSLSGGLARAARTGYNNSKNRE